MANPGTYYLNGPDLASSTSIYTDEAQTTCAPDGLYSDGLITRELLNCVLLPVQICPDCGIACGDSITPPGGNQGLYQLEFNAGTLTTDIGAISIHFNPADIPDGIRVLFDGVYYNRLSSPTDGNRQSTSGVADAFTILGRATDECESFCDDPNGILCTPDPNGNTINFFNGYDSNGWIPGTPSTQTVYIYPGDKIYGGQSEYNLLIVPKPTASAGTVTVQVLGPCDQTGWDIVVNCAEALPSFQGAAIGSSTSCGATPDTYYFGRFIQSNGTPDTNAFPIRHNPVFLDSTGSNRVPDGNYLMSNGQYIVVTDGVVEFTPANCT